MSSSSCRKGGSGWQEILDALTEKGLKDGTLHALSGVDTFSEKISRVQYSIGIRNKIASWISHCAENRYSKSGAVASKLRDEGNVKFAQKENVGVCLRLYSESVISAGEYGPELGLAYANRSATLYQLGHYEAAHQDISLALKHHYPVNLRYKLHQRHGACLARLGRGPEALQAFDRALASLKDALKLSSEKKEALTKDINALKVEVSKALEPKADRSSAMPPSEPSYGWSSEFPSASSKMQLQMYNGERRVITKDKVNLGETLFIESPYALVLLPGFYSSLCHHCTKAFVAPIPCLKCTQPRFCSEDCRATAWDVYHQFECKGLDLAHSVGIAHLALRIILNAGFPLLKSLKKDIQKVWKAKEALNFEELKCLDSDICNVKKNHYVKVFNLMDHVDDLSPEDLFQYTVTATLLTTYLQKRTKFFKQTSPSIEASMENLSMSNEGDDPEMFLFVAGLMLKHICQLVCNGSAIYEVLPDSISDTDMDVSNNNPIVYSTSQQRIATAIYPSVSMLNHSCNPNVINSFYEGNIIVRAIRPISSKSEVFNCYGPHFRRHSLSERREMLQFQYHFHCTCEVCSDESKFNFQDRFLALKCHYCAGPVYDSCKEGGSPSSAPGICADCEREQENSDTVREVILAYSLYKSGIDSLDRGLVSDALPLLQSCYQMRLEALYANHREVTEVANQLAKAYATMGSFEESAQYLQVTLPAILERFGEYSLEYAYELLNYADVMMCYFQDETKRISRFLEKIEETRNCLIKAAMVFDLHYGKWNKTYIETMNKFKKLDFFSENSLES